MKATVKCDHEYQTPSVEYSSAFILHRVGVCSRVNEMYVRHSTSRLPDSFPLLEPTAAMRLNDRGKNMAGCAVGN